MASGAMVLFKSRPWGVRRLRKARGAPRRKAPQRGNALHLGITRVVDNH